MPVRLLVDLWAVSQLPLVEGRGRTKGLRPTIAFSVLTLWKDMVLEMLMACRGSGDVFLVQQVNVRVWMWPVSTLLLVRLGGYGKDHAWCLGFRFFLSPYYSFLVIATSQMFTPKLSHN